MKSAVKLLLALCFVVTSTVSMAQAPPLQKQIKVHLIGLSHELPLSHKSLLHSKIGIGSRYSLPAEGYGISLNLTPQDFSLHALSEYRYYYSRDKWARKGKDLSYNAGNFVGMQAKLAGLTSKSDNFLLAEAHWGSQTITGKRLIYNYHLGLGMASNLSVGASTIYPAIAMRLAYVLPR